MSTLSALERDVLVVLYLCDELWMSRSAWRDKTNAARVVDERGRQLTSEGFKTLVATLIAKEVVSEQSDRYGVKLSWLAPVLEDAQQRGSLGSMVSCMRTSGHARAFWQTSRTLGVTGELRFALASRDADAVKHAEELVTQHRRYGYVIRLTDVLGFDVPAEWVTQLSERMRDEYLTEACEGAFVSALPLGPGLREVIEASSSPELRARLSTILALAGHADWARELARPASCAWERGALAFASFTEGDFIKTRELFAAARVGARKQLVMPPSYLAVFDLLLAVTSDSAAEVTELSARLAKASRQLKSHAIAKEVLESLVSFRSTGRGESLFLSYKSLTWIDVLICQLARAWIPTTSPVERDLRGGALDISSARCLAQAKQAGYLWLATELEAILHEPKTSALFSMFGQREGWELALDALAKAVVSDTDRAIAPSPERAGEVWWTITLNHRSSVDIEANLVSRSGQKGKRIALSRIDASLPLDDRDRKVVEVLAMSRSQFYTSYDSYPLSVIEALVGHPRVRDENRRPVEVSLGQAKIFVESTKSGAVVRLSPPSFDASGFSVKRESDGRITLIRQSPAIARIAAVLGQEGIAIPHRGLGALPPVLGELAAHVPVDASASLTNDVAIVDERVHVQLFRAGAGLRARLRVVPGGPAGASLRPGTPPAEIVIRSDAGLARVRRDLAAERVRVGELFERCPIFASLPQDGDDRVASELETCLELLVELSAVGDAVALLWPEGQALRPPTERSASDVRVRIRGDSTWLQIDGEVQVDEQRVIAMRDLLASASKAVGRFVPIGEDEYIALTEEIRSKLAALSRASDLSKDGRVPGALLPAMENVFDGLGVTFTEEIERRRAAIGQANSLDPMLPRDLHAELRDYQLEGFRFLVRRTEAGLGACLADDMGLGKTIQAIATLLYRAARGPALVVAPTSVCRNWEDEVQRFAPSLETVRFASGDRAAIVSTARAGQIVVASYALLTSESELFASRRWATVVFDEAHALKNAATHRWSAASALDAESSIALTGTPVENHIGEVHALFDVLAPGMLGSRAAFDRIFASAIARGDRSAVGLLRQLVRPFVLRRTKSQVLAELPPKTELLRVVVPTPEHRAFYEAVRRRAVERMTSLRAGKRAGQAHIEMLAEITRLRRAAVDPRLVGGEEAPSGSKLDALAELVLELRAEGRRALVFSQFLEVLDFAGARLKEHAIECRRLDGTMSAEARAAEVSAFQHGRADVFLLSLKAGGVGMNLTAADFVILLDPWWNPAVEDQAADRAHRIGQSRPVTVARLVTEGTIEDKVLTLHAKKRALYEDLVAGADGAGTLDFDALAALLDEGERAPKARGRGRTRAANDAGTTGT